MMKNLISNIDLDGLKRVLIIFLIVILMALIVRQHKTNNPEIYKIFYTVCIDGVLYIQDSRHFAPTTPYYNQDGTIKECE